MSTLNPSDLFLINRNGISYYVTQENLMAQIEDTDLLLVNRGGVSYKIPASEMSFGGPSNPLEPALPPFGGLTTTQTNLVSPDSKIVFSTNGIDYSSSLNIPIDTFYYVDWGTDILSAAQDSKYEATVSVSYPSLNINNSVLFEINSIDKLPDPFTFDSYVDALGEAQYTSNIISPLQTINAPTPIWVTSDAASFQIRLGNGPFFNPPAIPGTAYVSPSEEIQVRHTTGPGAATTYTTTVNIGYGTGAGEFEAGDFKTTTANVVYDIPTMTPGDNSEIDKNGQVFTLSTPTGSNVNLAATDWQFASDAAFTNILVESLNDSSNLLSYTLSGITEGQVLYARARFIDASGTTSSYAVSNNLTAKTFYFWRFQVRINGGGGGGGKYDGNTSNSGGGGGQGYVVFESLAASSTAPGSIERNDGGGGSSGSGTTGGSGAFGSNGGNGTYCGGNDAHRSGGGGGGGGVKLNGALLAGVGGGGGQGAKHSNSASQCAGGSGANLPSANGSKGLTPAGGGNNGGSSSSNPGGGNGGDSNGCKDDGKWSSGGGGGGFGPGTRGGVYGDAQGQGGGGGASWNQSIGYTNGGYALTHAQSGSVTGSSNQLAKYRALSTDPDNFVLVVQGDQSGVVTLASYN